MTVCFWLSPGVAGDLHLLRRFDEFIPRSAEPRCGERGVCVIARAPLLPEPCVSRVVHYRENVFNLALVGVCLNSCVRFHHVSSDELVHFGEHALHDAPAQVADEHFARLIGAAAERQV